MAVTQGRVNHLGRLADELLLELIKQPCLSDRDLISLALTNRRHYRVAISPAYKAHIARQSGIAIFWAIGNDRHETLDRLIENGVDVNMLIGNHRLPTSPRSVHAVMSPFHESTPLAWAASLGRDSMVDSLLDHGADIEQKSRLCNCCGEILQVCSMLPQVPFFGDDYSDTRWAPLHYALCAKRTSTARLLLERGANAVDIGNGERTTALHLATRWSLDNIIDYLIVNNLADINAQNCNGVTALHVAHLAGRYDLVNEFLDKGADINLTYRDLTGPWGILAMACADNLFNRARHYLRRGADPHFVLDSESFDCRYTVMRIIYHHTSDRQDPEPFPVDDIEERIALEQEIIARGNADHPVNKEEG